jgi:CheY-like chemotaxis protein
MARILLADDDSTVRDLVARVLLSGGHKVAVAQDGLEALALVEAGAPVDILVTDVNMPGLDGIALAKKVAAVRPGLRVLLMSGFPEQLAKGKADIPARVETLSKPCSIDDIRSALSGLV